MPARQIIYSLILSLLCLCYTAAASYAQNSTAPIRQTSMRKLGITKPLSDLVAIPPPSKVGKQSLWKKNKKPKVIPNFVGATAIEKIKKTPQIDPLWQPVENKNATFVTEPIVNIDGINYTQSYAYPPDPDGDVSPEHYIQAANTNNGGVFIIKDKQGNNIYGPADLNTLWSAFNYTGLGDPIVLYDHAAQRWILTELADIGTNIMLVAISVTNDPLGAWYAYELQAPDLPDYPKYGIWGDAIYITTNELASDNIPVYLLHRADLLAGASNVEVQVAPIPKLNGEIPFQVATPADWEGSVPPPADSPLCVLRLSDDAWADGADRVEVWHIKVAWGNPDATTVEGPIEVSVAPFDLDLCESFGQCLAQPNGIKLDALEAVIMNHARYRNFGSHETLLFNFSVDVDGNNRAGIRWCELRKMPNEDTWQLYQEGTYSPSDLHRFMGSLAMNGKGDICLAYSVMGEGEKPSLRVTGRRANDPLGEMTMQENQFATGLAYQNSFSRWGDYSCMAVDPSDDRTFWFTGEYMKGLDGLTWFTRIASFRFDTDSFDIAPVTVVSPSRSADLGEAEVVSLLIKNVGSEAVSDFEVGYVFENNTPVSKIINQSIEPDSTLLISFEETVNMDIIKPYSFTFFTNLNQDQLRLNDTLRAIISKEPSRDVALESVKNWNNAYCNTKPIDTIIIKNTGFDTLNSVKISWVINSSINGTMMWAGTLLPFESTNIAIQLDSFPEAGIHELVIFTHLPNGEADQRTENDTLTKQVTVQTNTTLVTLKLLTSLSPNETSWQIKDNSNNIIFSSGQYTEPYDTNAHFLCLNPDSCYSFIIYDSGNDGLDEFGTQFDGDFQLLDAQGNIIVDLGQPNFGSEATFDFCASYSCTLGASLSYIPVSEVGISDGTIIVAGTAGNPPFLYSINDGQTWQTSPVFNGLAEGNYIILIKDENECTASQLLELGVCTLHVTYTVTNATSAISNDGVVNIAAIGGTPPYKYSRNGGLSYVSNFDFTNLKDTTYYFCVKDAQGCRLCDTVVIGISTAAFQQNAEDYLKIFPNPTDGLLTLQIANNDADNAWVTILDANGTPIRHVRLVRYDNILTATTSLYAFPSGVYYVRIGERGVHRAYKIIKK